MLESFLPGTRAVTGSAPGPTVTNSLVTCSYSVVHRTYVVIRVRSNCTYYVIVAIRADLVPTQEREMALDGFRDGQLPRSVIGSIHVMLFFSGVQLSFHLSPDVFGHWRPYLIGTLHCPWGSIYSIDQSRNLE